MAAKSPLWAATGMGAILGLAAMYYLGRKDKVKEAINELETLAKNSELLDARGVAVLQARATIVSAKLLQEVLAEFRKPYPAEAKAETRHNEWRKAVEKSETRAEERYVTARQHATETDRELLRLLRKIAGEPEPEAAPESKPESAALLMRSHLGSLDALQDLLSLAMETPPTIQQIEARTEAERQAAAHWASAVHLAASDNNVVIPPEPDWLTGG